MSGFPAKPFDEYCIPEPNSGCWLWIGAWAARGYGIFRGRRAIRVAWEMFRGEIPPGLFVCHKCDVTCCVNPDHLWLGTTQDNTADMVRKGRQARGSRQGASRLTEAQVLAIRADIRPLRETAEAYGVGRSTVHDIRLGRSWGWLR